VILILPFTFGVKTKILEQTDKKTRMKED